MPLTPMTYTEISELLDHTDICRLLGDDTTRLLDASNSPTPKASTLPRPLDDPAHMAAVWQRIREQEHHYASREMTPQPPEWARPTAPPAPPVPAVPAWVWRYSALALSTGGAIGLAGWGIGQTAAWGPYLRDALYTLAVIAIGGAACAAAAASILGKLLQTIRARLERPHITQNITATGVFGRANGTVNHR
ncbi:hypothetical protein ACPCTO_13555 [Streptomyces olivoreticuli]